MPVPHDEVNVTLPLPTPLPYETLNVADPVPVTVFVAGDTLVTLPENVVVMVMLAALV